MIAITTSNSINESLVIIFHILSDKVIGDAAVDIRQAKVSAAPSVRVSRDRYPLTQDCCVKVVHVFVFLRACRTHHSFRRSCHRTPPPASSTEKAVQGDRVRRSFSPSVVSRGCAQFAAPNDQRVLEQSALLEIEEGSWPCRCPCKVWCGQRYDSGVCPKADCRC